MNDPTPRRRQRFRRLAILLGVVVALLLVWQCTWFQPSATGVVTDAAGKPVADAYVVAVHWGANYRSLAHATSYVCSGELLRTDTAGKYTIPSRLLFTGLLVGEVRPVVVATYAADRCTGINDPSFGGFDIRLPADAGAAAWFAVIDGLRNLAARDDGAWLDLAAAPRTELHTLIQREFERFLAAHGNEPAHGQTWSQYAQPIVSWHASHPPQ